jgi:hypothetical protein
MSENPLVAHEIMQETAFGLPPLTQEVGPSLVTPRRVVLRAAPALAALPVLQPVGIEPSTEGVASTDSPDGAWCHVPPPRSKAMSSLPRRARSLVLEVALAVVTLGVGWLAWSAFLWRRGQTPAKSLMRMRCIDTRTGAAAGAATMATREFGLKWLLGLATLGLTLMTGGLVALGERHEAMWDKAARTIVIDDPEGRYRP